MDMEVTLRKISLNDGEKERKFLLSFPAEENGFHRPGQMFNLETEELWKVFLQTEVDRENGKNLPKDYVPSTLFWILADGELAGIGKVRHCLSEALRKEGGHIGIGIAREFRGKGVGKAALAQLVDYTKSLGEEEVLVTNHADNIASRKMTEACGGKLEKVENGRSFYWL